MTGIVAAVGFLWPFAGTSTLEGLGVVVYVLVILLVLPLGWVVIRRRLGLAVAGPLWPLLYFLILSSTYALATPPWQTPDEPQHMLYSEIVRVSGVPAAAHLNDGKPLTRQEFAEVGGVARTVLRSVRQVDRWPDDAQALIDAGQIPGPAELSHPPLYYRVTAAVTEPIGGAPILTRLAVLRAFGVMVAGWIVWLCGLAGRLLWPRRPRLAEAPMAVAAGIPTFAGFAGTVNSDVLTNLWAAGLLVILVALLVRRSRRDWRLIVAAVGLAVLGVSTKRTFLPVLPLVPLALLLRQRPTKRQLLVGLIGLQLLCAGVVLSLDMRPAAWLVATGDSGINGCEGGQVGPRALCLVGGGISQKLPVAVIEEIESRVVTLGLWARVPEPATITVLVQGLATEPVRVAGPGWQFRRVQFVVPPRLRELQITLVSNGATRVDGVVLARGRYPTRPPQYAGSRGDEVRWDGRRVRNLLANGSGEDEVFAAPNSFPASMRRTLDGAMDAVYSVARSDRAQGSGRFVRERLGHTFGIFWGSAGWDQPPRLLPAPLRWLLGIIAATGFVGALAALATRRVWPTRAGVVMAATVAMGGLAVIARGIPPTDFELVSGRYLFPEFLAFTVVLTVGWRFLVRADDARFRRLVRWFAIATHLAFISFVFAPFRWG
jgi:hypothetical protein